MSTNISFLSKKFINLLTKDGKKLKASRLFFNMCFEIKKQTSGDLEKKRSESSKSIHKNVSAPLKNVEFDFPIGIMVSQAVENVKPNLEVRKVRIAGTTYMVPAILSKKKQESLALKWIIDAAKQRKKNSPSTFSHCLALEIQDASKKVGLARLKRDELHRLAEAKRAYIRYRWW